MPDSIFTNVNRGENIPKQGVGMKKNFAAVFVMIFWKKSVEEIQNKIILTVFVVITLFNFPHHSVCNDLFYSNNVNAADQLDSPSIVLTVEEKDWLKNHPVIRVVQDPGWPPVEFVDSNGNTCGITFDYLQIIEQRLGIKFERVNELSWQEAYSRLKKWEIDMTTSVTVTPERLKFWNFTKPYMTIPIVIVTHADVTYISSMKELSGKNVAVVDGYAVTDWIPKDFPDIKLVKVKNAVEGLELLQSGDVFAFIDNMLVAGYYMSKLKMINVKIAGETPYKNAQSMAIRKDWPILVRIIQKGLDSITESERDTIYYKWVPIRYEHGFDYGLLWKAISLFIILSAGLFIWNNKLLREIKKRKIAEALLEKSERKLRQHIKETPVGVIEWDTSFCVNDWNPAAANIFGYSRSEALGRHTDFIIPESIRNEINPILDRLITKHESVHSLNENITKNGNAIICDWISTPLSSADGKIIGVVSLVRDVTDQERAEELIKSALSEKEILIKELYHRTKNNMQVISSFLQLQSHALKDEKISFLVQNVVARIQAMALVHEKLYKSKNLSQINIREYLEELIDLMMRYYNISKEKITIDLQIEDVYFIIDTAIPVGLVVNEIISNSFKHAFPDNRKGVISVKLFRNTDNSIILILSDNGKGLPEGFDINNCNTLGFVTTVKIIEDQLQGTIDFKNANGLEFVITLKDDIYKERI